MAKLLDKELKKKIEALKKGELPSLDDIKKREKDLSRLEKDFVKQFKKGRISRKKK